MAYKAEIKVMLKQAILDPQGRAVETTLHRLGTTNVMDVRIGKHIELVLSGERAEVEAQLRGLIEQILSNPVMEEAHYTLTELSGPEVPG
jgi:phosphoribosylformylglycinamidine synthase PurS subunit